LQKFTPPIFFFAGAAYRKIFSNLQWENFAKIFITSCAGPKNIRWNKIFWRRKSCRARAKIFSWGRNENC